MFCGIDIGGTNTDVAFIDDEIITWKIPNNLGLPEALKKAPFESNLAISTSQPLNALLTGDTGSVRTITIPGPGLVYGGAVKGAVSPRGEILEPIDSEEIESILRSCHADSIAIAGKFSTRNSILEEIVRDTARQFFDDSQIAISAPLGNLDFPARVTTTQINAKLKGKVTQLVRNIEKTHPGFRFVTSDGGLCGAARAIDNPSLLYHSSPATVALGASYLSGKKDCLIVDIGGTTTDLVQLYGGKPKHTSLTINGRRTFIHAVAADTIPFGGDSSIRDTLMQFRSGNARAFGGGEPTLTDALNVTGEKIGTHQRSECLDTTKAEEAITLFIDVVSHRIHSIDPPVIVGCGFLAPYLIPDLASAARVPYIVPENAQSANAVGAAVSKVSISLHVHADTQRGAITLNGTDYPLPTKLSDEEMITYASDIIRTIARKEGAPRGDLQDMVVSQFSSYQVVRGGRVQARITDFVIGIAPGISVEAP